MDKGKKGRPTSINYSYDAVGRLIQISSDNPLFGILNFDYDKASRLLNLEHLGPLSQILEKISYLYDKNGNRIAMDRLNVQPKLPTPMVNATYNEANQMLTFQPEGDVEWSMTYDENGNLTSITNSCGTTTYTWDARNRLVAIEGFDENCNPLSASFKYDALGRRIEKTINGETIQYLYDGLDIVQEIKDGMVYANYIRTLNIDEPLARIKSDGTIRYYHADALGSVIALTDDIGTVRTQYNYSPFGETEIFGEPSDNPFQYTGRENDGTGLYYYRARYYSPGLKRFISEDPIGLFGGDVNYYVYVWNSPLKWIDLLGLDPIIIKTSDNWISSTPPGEVNPVLKCHVNPHRDPIENLIGAGIILSGIGVAIIPEAVTTTYPYVVSTGRWALIQTLANPGLIQNAADFIQGAFVPGPPPPTSAGYAGGLSKEAVDRIIKYFSVRPRKD